MSSATSNTAENPPCFRLFNLPQELQDSVFIFAYPEVEGLSIVFKDDWPFVEEVRKKKERSNFVRRAFPAPKVSEWLVSRKFFTAAARAWMPAQAPAFARCSSTYRNVCTAFLIQGSGLYMQSAAQATLDMNHMFGAGNIADIVLANVALCPRLQRLHLLVDEEMFSDLASKHACEHELEESDLEEVYEAKSCWKKLGGVREVTMSANRAHYHYSGRDVMVLRRNVDRFAQFLQKRMIGSQKPESASGPRVIRPLYHGSRLRASPEPTTSSAAHSSAKRRATEYYDSDGDEIHPKKNARGGRRDDGSPNNEEGDRYLGDDDIPDNSQDFALLALVDPDSLFRWAQGVKVRLAQSAEERG